MWVKKTTYPVMKDEPHLGTITESELMGTKEEAIEKLIEVMVNEQGCPEIFIVRDDITGEKIELETKDYLSNKQIDILNAAFIESCDWTDEQLSYLITLGETYGR